MLQYDSTYEGTKMIFKFVDDTTVRTGVQKYFKFDYNTTVCMGVQEVLHKFSHFECFDSFP